MLKYDGKKLELGVVAQVFNPRTQEAEADESQLRLVLSAGLVPGQDYTEKH